MPRAARLPLAPGIAHVFSRGNRRQQIYTDDRDRVSFLARLGNVVETFDWTCLAYCLMGNHFHLLVETKLPNLSTGMHRLNGGYARWFNDRHQLDGHLFEDRFRHVCVESDHQLLQTACYIILNPIRAGICSDPARWRWSSYPATAGTATAEPFLSVDTLLEHFGTSRASSRRAYRAFVRDGIALWREAHRAA